MDRYDVLSRFARTHRSTRAELAVYLALDHHRPGFMSLDDIAQATSLSPEEVEEVLKSFGSAGILQEAWLSGEPLYRRHAEVDYLAADPDSSSAHTDPVCGMRAPAYTPLVERDEHGNEHRFCSARCRAAFIAFPGLFSREAERVDEGRFPG